MVMFRIRPPFSDGVALNALSAGSNKKQRVSPLQNDPCMLVRQVLQDKYAINAINSATRSSWHVSSVPSLRVIARVLWAVLRSNYTRPSNSPFE
jgi:hypothetical protein